MIGDYDGRPFLWQVCLDLLASRFTSRPRAFKVDWGDAAVEIIARTIVGAIIGAIGCFISIRVLFWPGRSNAPSAMDQLGWGEWPRRVFWAIMLISIGWFVLTSRAKLLRNKPQPPDTSQQTPAT